MPARARDWTPGDEPRPEGEGWEVYAGDLMWVAGFTGVELPAGSRSTISAG